MSLEEEFKRFAEEADSVDEEARSLAIEISRWLSDRKIQNSIVILAISKIYAAICQNEGIPKDLSMAIASMGISANWKDGYQGDKSN